MTSTTPVVTLSPRDYDAVLFDLDGVLTKTARVHAAAWKKLFDGFLEQRAADTGEAFVPFDIDADYRRYVDGKPRYDGVADFLASRGIHLPFGTPKDGPGARTVHGLGNLKDKFFTEELQQHGIEVYDPPWRWYGYSGTRRSRPRSYPPAITVRQCSKQPA
jgi:beta-phosphoglucomutase-like phosphatase (HAD superfamily)